MNVGNPGRVVVGSVGVGVSVVSSVVSVSDGVVSSLVVGSSEVVVRLVGVGVSGLVEYRQLALGVAE